MDRESTRKGKMEKCKGHENYADVIVNAQIYTTVENQHQQYRLI